MPNYTPRRDFTWFAGQMFTAVAMRWQITAACLGMIAVYAIGASFAQSIMEGLPG